MSENPSPGGWTERRSGALSGASCAWDDRRMPAGRRSVLAVLSVLVLAGAGGCGGGSAKSADPRDTSPNNGSSTPSTGSTTQPSVPPDLALPTGVPVRATGPADAESTRIIRRWLAALDRGEVTRAAHFFALPSKFQNTGTPVLHIDSEAERIAVNLSLTCGARAEKTGGAGPYTIVLFRLIERPGPGGGCGGGTGGTARGAILVAGGRIQEWYRPPDDESADPNKVAPSGPSA